MTESLFDKTFRDDDGNLAIAQKPNLPSLVALTTTVLYFLSLDGGLQNLAGLLAFGSWFTWAWLELFQGVNYFRRTLGLVTLVGLCILGQSSFLVSL